MHNLPTIRNDNYHNDKRKAGSECRPSNQTDSEEAIILIDPVEVPVESDNGVITIGIIFTA